MNLKQLTIQHADDDKEDCIFFKKALEELQLLANHRVVSDGEELMQHLTDETKELPHILFPDFNMPRKNALKILLEIKLSKKLQQLTVIIFSTLFDQNIIKQLYENGAHYYICKPPNFSEFKKIIKQTFITLIAQKNISQPVHENFALRV